MKTAMLFTGSGPIVILTSHDSVADPILLEKLKAKGIERFMAYEIPLELLVAPRTSETESQTP